MTCGVVVNDSVSRAEIDRHHSINALMIMETWKILFVCSTKSSSGVGRFLGRLATAGAMPARQESRPFGDELQAYDEPHLHIQYTSTNTR